MATPLAFGKAQQPDVHRGHQVQVRDPFRGDQLQGSHGIESRLDDDVRVARRRLDGVGRRRRVIQRRADERPHSGADAERDAASLRQQRELFRGWRLAPYALRQPGGARGVDHRRAGHLLFGGRAVGRVAKALPLLRAGPRIRQPIGQAVGATRVRVRRDDEDTNGLGNAARNLLEQIGMHDQHLRLAVDQDVPHLGRLEVPVDRAPARAQPARGQHQLEHDGLVAQHHGDDLALRQSAVPERGGGADIPPEESLAGVGHAIELKRRLHGPQRRCGSIRNFSPVARLL